MKTVLPITITAVNYTEVKNIMRDLKLERYNIQLMSIGVKVKLHNLEDYEKVCSHLTNKKFKFFTHDKQNTLKFVLAGLRKMNINDIKAEISGYSINCIDKTLNL